MIALLSIILVLMGLSISAVKRVPAGQVVSVYRHGKPRRLLQEGTHMLVPGLDRVGHRINLGGQVLEFREPLPNAHDVRGTVYWQVLEPERADAVIDQADQLIRGGALAALREDPAAAEADRRDLGARLKLAMNQALRDRGVMVTRVELDFA
ncbi:SPFH domain-containing protein [Dyella marensis]|jgi:regulator of protease activity HflC (stomatin/prohibitin superfamily)|uniref:SPFH domain / Band 7 family protein n=1 Tax=Dyella marensis TaxID=500610 RepID=A0A1I2IRY3_9GAMM|nr:MULTISPECIES: SPFH domain-containing protein [Dyella]SFF44403.1 SPFH domain / Band 7 family protein [Dyella marensis]